MRPFFTCTVSRGGTQHTVAVWDGAGNFRSRPPKALIKRLTGVTIAQIDKPMTNGRSAIEAIDFFAESFDCVILWARNHRVYDSIVEELKQSVTLVEGETTKH